MNNEWYNEFNVFWSKKMRKMSKKFSIFYSLKIKGKSVLFSLASIQSRKNTLNTSVERWQSG